MAVTFAFEGVGGQQDTITILPVQQLKRGMGWGWCLWGEMESQNPLTPFNISFLPHIHSSAVGKFKFALSAKKSHAGAEHFNLDSHTIHINMTMQSKDGICWRQWTVSEELIRSEKLLLQMMKKKKKLAWLLFWDKFNVDRGIVYVTCKMTTEKFRLGYFKLVRLLLDMPS